MSETDSTEIPERFRDGDSEVRMGNRETALINESDTTREWFKIPGDDGEPDDVYWFDIKDISWEKKTDVLDDSLKTDSRTGEIELDLKDYYRNMMETVIADMSVDGGLAIFLKGMSPEVGDQLQEIVPDPGTVMDEVDEGN
jgi:hypothetical protein